MSSSVSDGTTEHNVMDANSKLRTRKNNYKDLVITAAISGTVIVIFAILIMFSSPNGQGGSTPTTGGSSSNPETPPQPIESSGPQTTVPIKLNNTCSKNTVNGTWVFFGTDKEHYQYDPIAKVISVKAYGVIHASQKLTVKINMTGPLDDPNDTIKPKTIEVLSSVNVQGNDRLPQFYVLSQTVPVNPNTWQYGSKFMLQAQYDKAWSCQSVFYIDHPAT